MRLKISFSDELPTNKTPFILPQRNEKMDEAFFELYTAMKHVQNKIGQKFNSVKDILEETYLNNSVYEAEVIKMKDFENSVQSLVDRNKTLADAITASVCFQKKDNSYAEAGYFQCLIDTQYVLNELLQLDSTTVDNLSEKLKIFPFGMELYSIGELNETVHNNLRLVTAMSDEP